MFRSSSDLPAKSMSTQVRPEDKFSGRLISKETSSTPAPNSSFRVYYGGVSGTVPFTWESCPGTPKHPLSHSTSLPPLTPPPSYYSYNSDSTHRRRRCSRSNLFRNFWSNFNQRTSSRRIPPSPSLSSSSWSSCSSTRSSSSSVHSMPSSLRGKNQMRNWEFFDHNRNKSINDDDDSGGWRTPCFGFGKQINGGSIRDVYAVGVAKKALQVLLGRGSGH
ncbi:uncharacterized protein LOC124909971 [Impatiens glandulifera]|uniref:uncharacterized protein LOC124909971 n=1 Tax=Impatiens glandulifera TaxID=253017 RepID=UPI001FB0C981|nr:uncharacterized protein LOC124909971 [Impatiens glandulifera]